VQEDTPTLHFILCLSAVWFGCINACREIVKERAIVERERLFGLALPAYVTSKAMVLGGVAAVQVVLLQGTVEWKLNLHGPLLPEMLVLWLASLAGVGLGLLVSALAGTQERAVFAVPLLILPQILFSEFAIPKEHFSDVVAAVEKLMPVRWAYHAFAEMAALETRVGHVLLDVGVLVLFSFVLLAGATLALLPRRAA
jgi:ABC-type multidrug transport system permease subunit